MVVRVEAAIIEELGRQKIAARSWGNSFEGLNPPVRWDAVTRAAIEAMREPTESMLKECVILYRGNGANVQYVGEEDGDIAVFPHMDDAIAYCEANKLFESGQANYQIVELSEL